MRLGRPPTFDRPRRSGFGLRLSHAVKFHTKYGGSFEREASHLRWFRKRDSRGATEFKVPHPRDERVLVRENADDRIVFARKRCVEALDERDDSVGAEKRIRCIRKISRRDPAILAWLLFLMSGLPSNARWASVISALMCLNMYGAMESGASRRSARAPVKSA